MKLRKRYEYDPDHFGRPRHVWVIECAQGAVHLHITDARADETHHKLWGGIELHHRQPPPDRLNDAPDHHNCPFTHGLCWHEGTSMGADVACECFQSEPKGGIRSHDYYFDLIEQWLRNRLIDKPSDVATLDPDATLRLVSQRP